MPSDDKIGNASTSGRLTSSRYGRLQPIETMEMSADVDNDRHHVTWYRPADVNLRATRQPISFNCSRLVFFHLNFRANYWHVQWAACIGARQMKSANLSQLITDLWCSVSTKISAAGAAFFFFLFFYLWNKLTKVNATSSCSVAWSPSFVSWSLESATRPWKRKFVCVPLDGSDDTATMIDTMLSLIN